VTTPSVRPAPAAREWVLHGLACLPLGRHPATLHEPAYLDAAARTLPRGCDDALRADGPAIAARMSAGRADILHALPAAFASIDALLRCAMAPADHALVGVSREILSACITADPDGTEWFLLDLALGARSFEAHHRLAIEPSLHEACARIAPVLERACEIDPSLRACEIELSSVLGRRGRAFGRSTLLAGAPGKWSGHSDEHVAIQLLHERAVQTASDADYVRAEWDALTSLALRVEGTALHDAHAGWIRGIDLRPLAQAAHALGLIAREDLARALIRREGDPANTLRRCAATTPALK
jgi:hypothetical protein